MHTKLMSAGLLCATICVPASRCLSQEQYPKPLIHTASDHPADRILLLNVDALNAIDLALWIKTHPKSALAELSGRGVTYTNAHVPWPDEAAGLLALVTGGTPISAGIVSQDGFDRELSLPSSDCTIKGSAIRIDDSIADSHGSLDATKLPRDSKKGCSPVPPHSLVRVNNIFEIMKQRGGRTAWLGRNAALTDLYQGPSGSGLSETCVATSDAARVKNVLLWIAGKTCDGTAASSVPIVMGMEFTAVADAKKISGNGYSDAIGRPSIALAKALGDVDDEAARMVRELKANGLFDSTWIVVTAPYGIAPKVAAATHIIPLTALTAAAESIHRGAVLHIRGGAVAMLWLRDPTATDAVVHVLSSKASALGIASIATAEQMGLVANRPSDDSRMPDIMLWPATSIQWGSSNLGSGLAEDDHVAMLISGKQLTGRVDKTTVPVTQLAPLLLRALGMEKFDLQSLHQEHSPALPGIF